jgi:signal peptidase I
MDWLANITLPYIIIAVVVLFIARLVLGKYESAAAKQATEFVESALIAVVLVFLIIRPFIVQAFYIPSGSMEPTLLGHDYPTRIHDHILVNKFIYRFQEPRHGDIIVFKSPPGVSASGPMSSPSEWNRVVGRVISPAGNSGAVKVAIDRDCREDVKRLRDVFVAAHGDGEVRSIESISENADVIKFLGVDDAVSAESLTGAALKVGEKDFIKRVVGIPGDTIEVKSNKGVVRNGKLLKEPYIAEIPLYDMKPVKIPKGRLFVMGDNRNNSNDSHAWGTLARDRVIGKSLVRFWPLTRIGIPR